MSEAPIHDLNKFRENAQARGDVICVRCKGLVEYYATRCAHCAMNYDGPAFQFCEEVAGAETPTQGRGCVGLALLMAILVVILYAVTA